MKHYHAVLPPLALVILAFAQAVDALWPTGGVLLRGITLILAVLSAVHHAEVVAHRTGEPMGTLVLALAVTIIEAALILSFMLMGSGNNTTLARDTLFSAIMIIGNGVVGLCLLLGGWRHREQVFRVQGVGPALAALLALSALSLVLPTFTTSSPGGTYTSSQLVFVSLTSLALWGVFTFFQTVRHRDYFLPEDDLENTHAHAEPPTWFTANLSLLALVVCLVVVVGLAKQLSPTIESTLRAWGAPQTLVGIVIALLVLMPETLAALRAAKANRLQTSLNLALGSALASIGLTIPAVALTAVWLGIPLTLGLDNKDLVMLVLTFMIGSITLAQGRTSMMQGAVHLVIFAAFLFLSLVP
jgi:Ca2+:H+ antiporter